MRSNGGLALGNSPTADADDNLAHGDGRLVYVQPASGLEVGGLTPI